MIMKPSPPLIIHGMTSLACEAGHAMFFRLVHNSPMFFQQSQAWKESLNTLPESSALSHELQVSNTVFGSPATQRLSVPKRIVHPELNIIVITSPDEVCAADA